MLRVLHICQGLEHGGILRVIEALTELNDEDRSRHDVLSLNVINENQKNEFKCIVHALNLNGEGFVATVRDGAAVIQNYDLVFLHQLIGPCINLLFQ